MAVVLRRWRLLGACLVHVHRELRRLRSASQPARLRWRVSLDRLPSDDDHDHHHHDTISLRGYLHLGVHDDRQLAVLDGRLPRQRDRLLLRAAKRVLLFRAGRLSARDAVPDPDHHDDQHNDHGRTDHHGRAHDYDNHDHHHGSALHRIVSVELRGRILAARDPVRRRVRGLLPAGRPVR